MIDKIPLLRMNSRIRKDQKKYIRDIAKSKKVGDGVIHREIIDYYINNHKNKNNVQ